MIDLVAALRLKDDFSKPLQKVSKVMDNAEKVNKRLDRSMKKMNGTFRDTQGRLRTANGQFATTRKHLTGMTSGFKGMSNGLKSVMPSLNPVAVGLGAIAGAATAAYGAVKIFNATVGEALKMEQSQVVISAMFNDKALSKQYMQLLDRISIDSPVLDSQAMYGNSKAFITQSKDIKQLEKMWGLAERMVAIDPAQGVDGAVLALRELFSGDSMSMVERFEMSRDVMNDIKKMSLDDQLTELDRYFNKIGLTTKVIDEMGGTALGMWAQVQERWQLIMRQMGEPSVKVVSEFMGNILDRLEGPEMQKFAEWGANAIKNMLQGLTDSAVALYDWFTALQNDPEFQKRTTFTGKIDFILEDVGKRLKEWYDNGGRETVEGFATGVTETMVTILSNSVPFAEIGVKLGASLVEGLKTGIWESTKDTELGWILKHGLGWDGTLDKVTQMQTAQYMVDNIIVQEKNKTSPAAVGIPGYYHGLDEVKYDNQVVRVHKGEKILTAQEAKAYDEGETGGFVFNYNGSMQIREEADVQKVAHALYNAFRSEATQRGHW